MCYKQSSATSEGATSEVIHPQEALRARYYYLKGATIKMLQPKEALQARYCNSDRRYKRDTITSKSAMKRNDAT